MFFRLSRRDESHSTRRPRSWDCCHGIAASTARYAPLPLSRHISDALIAGRKQMAEYYQLANGAQPKPASLERHWPFKHRSCITWRKSSAVSACAFRSARSTKDVEARNILSPLKTAPLSGVPSAVGVVVNSRRISGSFSMRKAGK